MSAHWGNDLEGSECASNEELEEGFSDSDSNNNDDSRPAGRQGHRAEFWEEWSLLRQKKTWLGLIGLEFTGIKHKSRASNFAVTRP
ncbi:MAG: hypothetical protein WCF30_01095 [Terracidiphilus sp.]